MRTPRKNPHSAPVYFAEPGECKVDRSDRSGGAPGQFGRSADQCGSCGPDVQGCDAAEKRFGEVRH